MGICQPAGINRSRRHTHHRPSSRTSSQHDPRIGTKERFLAVHIGTLGTALRCGRGGSRHFRRHRGFIPRGLFVYVATRHRRSVLPLSEGAASAEDGNSPPSTLPAFYLSVKKKKILRSKDTDVRFTELLIGGGGGKRKKYRYRP